MKSVLYVRVSTTAQRVDRQVLLSDSKFDLTLVDKISGSIPFFKRPKGKVVFEMLKSNKIDSLTVHSIDRLGRNLMDILSTIEVFNKHKVPITIKRLGLTTFENGKINPIAKLIVSLLGSIYEMERETIIERIKEGIAVSKLKGIQLGRKFGTTESIEKFLSKPKSKKISVLLDKGYSVREVSSIVDCSGNTVLKVKSYAEDQSILNGTGCSEC